LLGVSVNRALGVAEGLAVLGASDGLLLGDSDNSSEGAVLGRSVGLDVGLSVVGFIVVGISDGLELGDSVIATEGALVGLSEGLRVDIVGASLKA